jgi:hypothetical protein
MPFPETIIGTCQVCGADGRDQTASLTGADAEARSTTGNGIELTRYDGKMMCDICINEAKAKKESLAEVGKYARDEQFRAKAGFTNTI